MHLAGWIHRDISTGNILIDANGNARLADLEYAKRLEDNSIHVVRTVRVRSMFSLKLYAIITLQGTADFMSIEVDHQRYLFSLEEDPTRHLPPKADPEADYKLLISTPPDDNALPEPPTQNRSSGESLAKQKSPPIPFRHNTLHDVESMFWCLTIFPVDREVVCNDSDSDNDNDNDNDNDEEKQKEKENEEKRRAAQRALAGMLFYDKLRRRQFLEEADCTSYWVCLHPSLSALGETLEKIRLMLGAAYRAAEKNLSAISNLSAEDTCSFIFRSLITLRNTRVLKDIFILPKDSTQGMMVNSNGKATEAGHADHSASDTPNGKRPRECSLATPGRYDGDSKKPKLSPVGVLGGRT